MPARDKNQEKKEHGHFSVSAAELNRRFGEVQTRVNDGPVVVTYHGRPRLVVISLDQFEIFTQSEREAGSLSPQAYQQKIDAILDSISEGYVSVNQDWTIRTINRVAEMFFDTTRDQIIGQTWDDAFPHAREGRFKQQIRRAILGREAISSEIDSTIYRGQRLAVKTFPLPDNGGAGVVFSNITEPVRAAIIDAAFTSLCQTMPEAIIFVHDDGGRISCWSAGAERHLGWREDEIVGSSVEKILSIAEMDSATLSDFLDMAESGTEQQSWVYRDRSGADLVLDGRSIRLSGLSNQTLKLLHRPNGGSAPRRAEKRVSRARKSQG